MTTRRICSGLRPPCAAPPPPPPASPCSPGPFPAAVARPVAAAGAAARSAAAEAARPSSARASRAGPEAAARSRAPAGVHRAGAEHDARARPAATRACALEPRAGPAAEDDVVRVEPAERLGHRLDLAQRLLDVRAGVGERLAQTAVVGRRLDLAGELGVVLLAVQARLPLLADDLLPAALLLRVLRARVLDALPPPPLLSFDAAAGSISGRTRFRPKRAA